MSTVLGELAMEFESGATHTTTVEVPVDLARTIASPLWALELDVPALVLLWGPVVDLSWTTTVVPAIIPLPPAAWLLAGAVAWLATRARV